LAQNEREILARNVPYLFTSNGPLLAEGKHCDVIPTVVPLFARNGFPNPIIMHENGDGGWYVDMTKIDRNSGK